MLRKLNNFIVKQKIKHAYLISKKKYDKYGFVFLGLCKPYIEDDYMYTHTRAIFHTKYKTNNIQQSSFDYLYNKNSISIIRVGRSFILFAKNKKFNSIVDLITTALEYNKFGRISTMEAILKDIPTSIYANEEACEEILDSIIEYPNLLQVFLETKKNKLLLIEKYKKQVELENAQNSQKDI